MAGCDDFVILAVTLLSGLPAQQLRAAHQEPSERLLPVWPHTEGHLQRDPIAVTSRHNPPRPPRELRRLADGDCRAPSCYCTNIDAFVQAAYATPQTPQASVPVTYAAAQTAGNLNVVIVGWNDTTAQVQTLSDTRGNVYVRAVGPTVRSGLGTQSIYYAVNIAESAAGGNTVTVAFTVPAIYADVRIAEYRGIDISNPVDQVKGASGSGTTSNSGVVTTTNANNLLVSGNLVAQRTTGAAGTGYTSRVITVPDSDILEDRVVTTVGSYSGTARLSGGASGAPAGGIPGRRRPSRHAGANGAGRADGDGGLDPQVNLSWTASTDNVAVTGYLVERCQGAECTTSRRSGRRTGRPTRTRTGGEHDLRLPRARHRRRRQPQSATRTSRAPRPGPPDTQAADGAQRADGDASGPQVNLGWTASTDNVGVTGYRSSAARGRLHDLRPDRHVDGHDLHATPACGAATTYRYRVRATDAASNLSGVLRTIATATTPAAPDTQPPTAPSADGDGRVGGADQSQLDGVDGQRGRDGLPGRAVPGRRRARLRADRRRRPRSFSDTGLAARDDLQLPRACDRRGGNLSAYSKIASATTPTPPDTQAADGARAG